MAHEQVKVDMFQLVPGQKRGWGDGGETALKEKNIGH